VRAKEAAEAASRAKSDFLSTMSLAIRTPLNGIVDMTQLLLNAGLTPEARRDCVQTILSSSQNLLELISDIAISTENDVRNQLFGSDSPVASSTDRDARYTGVAGPTKLDKCAEASTPTVGKSTHILDHAGPSSLLVPARDVLNERRFEGAPEQTLSQLRTMLETTDLQTANAMLLAEIAHQQALIKKLEDQQIHAACLPALDNGAPAQP
jgi:hypothetical protein